MDAADRHGFVPVSYENGTWKTNDGHEVPWYEVQTDLLREAEVQGALERVLSVYGVSDVVVDAFDQFRKELMQPSPDEGSSPSGGGHAVG
ncbi:MAG TPA: hypothetical protein VF990_12620 [Candidatus Dormibacteraeota bacterium]